MDGNGSAAGVVLAGGSGSRLGAAGNKVYLPLAGRPVLAWSLRAFVAAGVDRLVLVVRAQDEAPAAQVIGDIPVTVECVPGGSNRHASEHNALTRLAPEIRAGALDVVAIHDGARPFVRPALIRASLDAARRYGAAVPGVPLDDVAVDGAPARDEPADGPAVGDAAGRDRAADVAGPGPPGSLRPVPAGTGPLVRVQTPQAFRAGPLLRAYDRAAADGFTGTDTASCVERYAGVRVHHFAGDPRNLKVTFQHDLAVAEALAASLLS